LRREVDILVRHSLYLTTLETIQKKKVYVERFIVLNEATFTKEDPTEKQKTKRPNFIIFHKVCIEGTVLTALCRKTIFSAKMSKRIIAQHQSHPGIDPNSLMYDSIWPAARTFLLSVFLCTSPLPSPTFCIHHSF